jgi:two-component system response regulator PilR (NtrC family)
MGEAAVAPAVAAPSAAPSSAPADEPAGRAEAAESQAEAASPLPPASDELPSNLPDYLNQVERDIILRALNQTQFNRTQAAGLLGISLRQLRYTMQKLNIHAPEP